MRPTIHELIITMATATHPKVGEETRAQRAMETEKEEKTRKKRAREDDEAEDDDGNTLKR